MRCDDCQALVLDLAYGLLDPTDAAALVSHVATCPACTGAMAVASGNKSLIARAAKTSFPKVQFVPPIEGAIEPKRSSPRTAMVRWAVAAGILLAVAGTVGPTIQSSIRSAAADDGTRNALASVRQARQSWTTEKANLTEKSLAAKSALESATKEYDAVVTDWALEESVALAAKTFAVEVTGPASAVAGAPNDYRIRVADPLGQPVAASVEVAVSDSTGKVRAEAKYDPVAAKAGTTFRLPASVWTDLPTGAGLTLAISATNPATGQKSRLAEPINLLPPVYATFLATDRPLYQPGETLFFRSVTLDRARFLPPGRDLALRFDLLDAKGNAVAGLTLTGRSSPALLEENQLVPVLGPDGKPVRGVGCGAFALSEGMAGGEYTLVVYELPDGWTKAELPVGTIPLAKRKVHIRKYVPARLATDLEFGAASYGPGDTVAAKLTATEGGRPLANVQILPSASVDGKRITPVRAPSTLDAAGSATVTFTLPNDAKMSRVDFKVTILHEPPEEVARSVPLASKAVGVEFFPEGGDLIAGLEGRVYFRVRTPDGRPVEFRGNVWDGDKVVSVVATTFDKDQPGTNRGLGVFALEPAAGTRYVLRGPAGEFPLPMPKTDGVVLNVLFGVIGANQPISLRLASGTSKKSVVVGAYARGVPIASARAVLEPGKETPVELRPEAGSPGGVTRITVFEESEPDGPGRKTLTPVAERLMFRRPVEALVLSYSAAQSGPLAPGAHVGLSVRAKTESGQPTGAILWAAVVNETVFGRNDDRTAHGLPAHFLVCGEVEKPDDLEYADFLLTDHPQAVESLDLVLGTQGWRRFAEQAPGLFRKTASPDEADRLMVAVGSRGPVPAEFRPLVQRVAEHFRPKYETVREKVETAERTTKADSSSADAARQQYALALGALAQIENSRPPTAAGTIVPLPTAFALIALAGGLTFARYRLFLPGEPERKYLTVAALCAVGLAGFLFVVVSLGSPADPNETAAELNRANAFGIAYSGTIPYGAANPGAISPVASAKIHGSSPIESARMTPGGIGRTVPVTAPTVGIGTPLESAANGRPAAKPLLRDPGFVARLAREYADKIEGRLATALPANPASERVKDAVSKLPPLVVREYAHVNADPRFQTRGTFDSTDTVLWQPVLVVPGQGMVNVSFTLSGSTAGYRILIAGHTLDGRVGTVTGFLPIQPAVVDQSR